MKTQRMIQKKIERVTDEEYKSIVFILCPSDMGFKNKDMCSGTYNKEICDECWYGATGREVRRDD